MNRTIPILTLFAVLALPQAGTAGTFDDGNPGETAMECVDAGTREISYSDTHRELIFRNRCDHEIFIAYCGDFKFHDRDCGDGEQYYTHATPEIEAGGYEDLTLAIDGHYEYAACKGGHGFDISEWFRADADGDFRCLATGAYAEDASGTGDPGGAAPSSVDDASATPETASPAGRWEVEIGNDRNAWATVLTLERNGDATYYSVADAESYPARWEASGRRVTLWAYGTRQHYNRDDPALRIDLRIEGRRISGTQYNLVGNDAELWVRGERQ